MSRITAALAAVAMLAACAGGGGVKKDTRYVARDVNTLYRAAQAIKSQIRSDDELVRYGGDEFFLLFRDLPQQILEKKLQSIRAALDEIVIEEYPEPYISASIGGAFAAGRILRTIRRADLAMYQAKLKKDCVAIYREAKEHET